MTRSPISLVYVLLPLLYSLSGTHCRAEGSGGVYVYHLYSHWFARSVLWYHSYISYSPHDCFSMYYHLSVFLPRLDNVFSRSFCRVMNIASPDALDRKDTALDVPDGPLVIAELFTHIKVSTMESDNVLDRITYYCNTNDSFALPLIGNLPKVCYSSH